MTPVPPQEDASAPLNAILLRLSVRIASLAKMARALEDVSNLPCQRATSPEVIESLQNIDYLRQALDDLTVLTADLGTCGDHGAIDASLAYEFAQKLDLAASKSVLDVHLGSITSLDRAQSTGEPLIF